jgi:hypothetical protein
MATTKLKLHREPARTGERAEEIPATFRFPVIPRGRGERGQAQRETLVAGRVEPGEEEGKDPGRELRPPPLRFRGEDGTTRTPALIEQIERTLEAMQARVDRLRKQAEEPYKFPSMRDDDHRPTAA